MSNLEKMKQNVIEQIENMNIREFERFMDAMIEFEESSAKILDVSNLFTCELCRKRYGKCLSNTIDGESCECNIRFEKYAISNE